MNLTATLTSPLCQAIEAAETRLDLSQQIQSKNGINYALTSFTLKTKKTFKI